MSARIQPVKQETEASLYQKLIEVMEEIGRVEKRGYNSFHNYAYVKEDDLVEAVRSKLSDRGILLLPSVETCERDGTLTTITMTFTFVDSVSGETHVAKWAGTGDDKGDKGLYKAYTGAEKYFLMKAFLIPTGDDPEGDEKTDKRAEHAPVQQAKSSGTAKTQYASTERDELVRVITAGANTLNQRGEKFNLWGYVNETYAVQSGIADLTLDQIRRLTKEVSDMLDQTKTADGSAPQGVPRCGCGIARERKQGVTKQGKNKGKPWAAWMCANRAEGCDPLWIDLDAEAEDNKDNF